MFLLAFLFLFVLQVQADSVWIDYPADGTATMTHYTIPDGFVAACGCTGESTKYPTAAISTAFGPACGKCFNLTLLNTYTSDPPGWCSGTQNKTNPGGQYINFDLAYPSSAIPDNFFPSNASLYGYTDFGVWNVSYQTVSCLPNWLSVCCPANPTFNSYLRPDTETSVARMLVYHIICYAIPIAQLFGLDWDSVVVVYSNI
ncbi:hypothetical protein B0H10DRAFT_2001442 [Mycena sp. CBHHK59/15]|nr:hypothetical protein B0H10DRAFT_2001442 [Mycena sp. CBHHK59/15]